MTSRSVLEQADQAVADRLTEVRPQSVAGIIVLFCFIAVLNTLLMSTTECRRDLAILRLAGATRRQVVWALAAESLLVSAVGIVLAFADAECTYLMAPCWQTHTPAATAIADDSALPPSPAIPQLL